MDALRVFMLGFVAGYGAAMLWQLHRLVERRKRWDQAERRWTGRER